jgi:hypothetical protein
VISWFQAFAFTFNLCSYTQADDTLRERGVMSDGRGLSLAYSRPRVCKPHLSCVNIFTTTEATTLIAA